MWALGKTELKGCQRCLQMLMSWVTSVTRTEMCSFFKQHKQMLEMQTLVVGLSNL